MPDLFAALDPEPQPSPGRGDAHRLRPKVLVGQGQLLRPEAPLERGRLASMILCGQPDSAQEAGSRTQ